MMLTRFTQQTAGSISIMVGLLLIPLFLAVGIAIDYSRGVKARQDLQAASDAAALALLQMTDASAQELSSEAFDIVKANIGGDITNEALTVTAERGDTGTITVDAELDLSAYFIRFGDFQQLTADVRSIAGAAAGEYIDIYLMVDRSSSTLIARPGADMTAMLNLTRPLLAGTSVEAGQPDGCAFACHALETWQTGTTTFLELARDNNITLRSKAVTDAASTLAQTVLGAAGDNLRIGVIDFAESAVLSLPPTTNIAAITAALDTPAVDYGRSHYHEAFDLVTSTLGSQGSGRRASDPRKMLVLITDGAYSQIYADGTQRPNAVKSTLSDDGSVEAFYELFDPTVCQPALDAGFNISVINTIYFPLVNSNIYDGLVGPYADDIDDSLRACVTDSYFDGVTAGEIEDAFQDLAETFAIVKPRLVQ